MTRRELRSRSLPTRDAGYAPLPPATSSSLVDWARLRLAAELSESENASIVLSAVGADEIGVTNFARIVGVLGGGRHGMVDLARKGNRANRARGSSSSLPRSR